MPVEEMEIQYFDRSGDNMVKQTMISLGQKIII